MSETAHDATTTEHALVRHAAVQAWGAGILLHEDDARRSYQFEDGEVRVFDRGWFHLLRPLEDAPEALAQRLLELAKANGAPVARRADTPSFEDQLSQLRAAYPAGFADAAWLSQRRGDGDGRRLRRHRDPAIAMAATELAAETLRGLIAAGQPAAVRDRWLEVMAATDLVTSTQLDPLRAIDVDERLAAAIVDFLHGHGDDASRDEADRDFDRLRLALAHAGVRTPSWQAFTAARALTRPDVHVYVRPSLLRQQAACLGDALCVARAPNPADYARVLAHAQQLRTSLAERGLTPRDLLDVHDFSALTAKPRSTALAIH